MADSLGLKGPSSNAFLTEPLDTEVEAEKDEAPSKWSKMRLADIGVPLAHCLKEIIVFLNMAVRWNFSDRGEITQSIFNSL